eukprot:CCRYP_017345-RB/>CCRYP_017345-RB protein AED:0.48 eAED:1.00 QI:0/0/0/1/0/0/2/0/83
MQQLEYEHISDLLQSKILGYGINHQTRHHGEPSPKAALVIFRDPHLEQLVSHYFKLRMLPRVLLGQNLGLPSIGLPCLFPRVE